mmetsp:Transcript_44360/g.70472  ORF Transcript_44360/g.70472 Transcript_44360/m.70472 type:complete len:220 (-) Transcript_44360:199-858(-)
MPRANAAGWDWREGLALLLCEDQMACSEFELALFVRNPQDFRFHLRRPVEKRHHGVEAELPAVLIWDGGPSQISDAQLRHGHGSASTDHHLGIAREAEQLELSFTELRAARLVGLFPTQRSISDAEGAALLGVLELWRVTTRLQARIVAFSANFHLLAHLSREGQRLCVARCIGPSFAPRSSRRRLARRIASVWWRRTMVPSPRRPSRWRGWRGWRGCW